MVRKAALVLVLVVAVVLPSAVPRGWASTPQVPAVPGDQRPRVAIVSAFPPELERLVAEAKVTRKVAINGRTFHVGELRGVPVVMFVTGISMVNAAMMTQAALDHFNVTNIVVSGIAGGVDPLRHIGAVTVPARWAQYQENLFAREVRPGEYDTNTGFHTDELGNFGMMFPQYVSTASEAGPVDVEAQKFWFDMDETMLAVAESVAGEVELERCTDDGVCLSHEPEVIVGGRGVSGPTFVDNAGYRTWVYENFEADALDMETAAIAHVAYANDVPMIAFRSLSDLAGGGPGGNEILVFFQLAAANSAEVVTAFLDAWRQRASTPAGQAA